MMFGRVGLDLLEKGFSINLNCYFSIKISNKNDRKPFAKYTYETF
jgi:hypothetical protein